MKLAIVLLAAFQVVVATNSATDYQNKTSNDRAGHNNTYKKHNNSAIVYTAQEEDHLRNTNNGIQVTDSVRRESPDASEEISTQAASPEHQPPSTAPSNDPKKLPSPSTGGVHQLLMSTTSSDLQSIPLVKFANNSQRSPPVMRQPQYTTATPLTQTNPIPSINTPQSLTSNTESYSTSSIDIEQQKTLTTQSTHSTLSSTPQSPISVTVPDSQSNAINKFNFSLPKLFQTLAKPAITVVPEIVGTDATGLTSTQVQTYSENNSQPKISRRLKVKFDRRTSDKGWDLTTDKYHAKQTKSMLHILQTVRPTMSALPVFTTLRYEMMNDGPAIVDESTDQDDKEEHHLNRKLQNESPKSEVTLKTKSNLNERPWQKDRVSGNSFSASFASGRAGDIMKKNTSGNVSRGPRPQLDKTKTSTRETLPVTNFVNDSSSITNRENVSKLLQENTASKVQMGLPKTFDIVIKDGHNINLTDDMSSNSRKDERQTEKVRSKKRLDITTLQKTTDSKNNVPENVIPTDTAVLKFDKNSSKLIGYSDDPFNVSDVLHGESRNVEILHDEEKVDSQHPLIHYIQNRRTSHQRRMANVEVDTHQSSAGTANSKQHPNDHSRREEIPGLKGNGANDLSLERFDSPGTDRGSDSTLDTSDSIQHSNHDEKQNASVIMGEMLALPVAEFRGIETDPAKPIIDGTSIIVNHSENKYVDPLLLPETIPLPVDVLLDTFPATSTNQSVLKSVNRNSDNYLLNSSEIIHHEGISYIRKNFLIMPVNNNSIYNLNLPYNPSSSSISSVADVPSTTEISLLNKRVPIYQEIAGSMHIDSSIDDTLDSDEPISPATEDDGDEVYLPQANTSAVNLVDPLIKLSPDNGLNFTIGSNGVESEINVSGNRPREADVGEEDEDWNNNTASSVRPDKHSGRSRRDRHYSFVLKQKEELMSSLLDHSADPCQDFYQYACGGWTNRFTLRPDQAEDNTFERLRDDLDSVLVSLLEEESPPSEPPYTTLAKTLYKGCMNVDAIESAGTKPLLELLDRLGGWPVLEGDAWDHSTFDVTLQIARLRTLNNEVLLAESVADDVTNSSRRIVQLDQPKLGLPGRNYYLSNSDQKYREAYLNLMLQACHLLGADPLVATRDMAEVLFFETELAKVLVPAEERRNLSAIHRLYSREKLKQEYPGISWDLYLDTIAPNHTAFTQEVRLFCRVYLHDLLILLNSTEPRTVSNYLLWRLVKNRLGNLGSEALEVKHEYIRVLFGRSTQPNRWRSCITYVNGNLGGIVGSMFVARYFPEESRRDTEEMISLIREAFRESVSDADWMLPETRQTASDKVRAIVWNVGYPEELLNTTYMEETFGQLQFSPRSHFTNVLRMLRYHSERPHAQLGTPVNRTTWAAVPAIVNAYYSRTKNMIMFPAGILQPPFYHPAYPRALNYGGIGVVIGHEISHGFDDGGRQFDKKGNLQQWWAKKDVMAFYARATCMLEQYSRFEVPELDMPVNAISTLGENIADNAGLNIAYTAYQKWMTSHSDTSILRSLNLTLHQLFFLNFGQIWCEVTTPEAALTNLRSGQHSPNRFRVIGTLSNSRAFSEAFQCQEGTPMNPRDKCAVW